MYFLILDYCRMILTCIEKHTEKILVDSFLPELLTMLHSLFVRFQLDSLSSFSSITKIIFFDVIYIFEISMRKNFEESYMTYKIKIYKNKDYNNKAKRILERNSRILIKPDFLYIRRIAFSIFKKKVFLLYMI